MNRWVITCCLLFLSSQAAAGGTHQMFELGELSLESGQMLPGAKLSYVTHGTLNAEKSNVVLLPSYYLGDHHGYDFLIGEGLALDPSKYFIVATDMFQNGLSSSPSNTPPPLNGPDFPEISIRDNVAAVHQLLTDEFGVEKIFAVVGFSMGAQQSFQWAVSHPDKVERAVGYCGSAVEYPHGIIRLEGFKQAIMTDSAFNGGNYIEPPEAGLAAGGTHWAAWGYSQEWFRTEAYRKIGASSLNDVDEIFKAAFSAWDSNDLIAMASTWQNNNVGNTPGFGGDYEKALKSIRAKVLYMPCETDLYFHIDALTHEAGFIPGVQLTVIPSIWGHNAGIGVNPEDAAFINKTIKAFLAKE